MPQVMPQNSYTQYIPNITPKRMQKIEEAKLFKASTIEKIQYATKEGFSVQLRVFLHKYLGIYNNFYTEIQKKHVKIAAFFVENVSENVSEIIDNITKDKDINDVRDAIISNVFAIQQILEPFNMNFLLEADDNNNNIKINFSAEGENISYDIPCNQDLYEILKEVFGTNNYLNSSQNKYAYLKYYNNFINKFHEQEEENNRTQSNSIALSAERRASAIDIARYFTDTEGSFAALLPEGSTGQQKSMLYLLCNQKLFTEQYISFLRGNMICSEFNMKVADNDASLKKKADISIELDNEKVILTYISNMILISEDNSEDKKVPIKFTVKVKIDELGTILEFSTIDTLINNGKSLNAFSLDIRFFCKTIASYSNYITTIRNGKIPTYAQQIQKKFNAKQKRITQNTIILFANLNNQQVDNSQQNANNS